VVDTRSEYKDHIYIHKGVSLYIGGPTIYNVSDANFQYLTCFPWLRSTLQPKLGMILKATSLLAQDYGRPEYCVIGRIADDTIYGRKLNGKFGNICPYSTMKFDAIDKANNRWRMSIGNCINSDNPGVTKVIVHTCVEAMLTFGCRYSDNHMWTRV